MSEPDHHTKIAICFYGITRSLPHTIESIERNIIAPCRKLGEVRVFAHFFQQDRVENKRSRENVALNLDDYKLLNADVVELEQPDLCLESYDFESLKRFGDARRDGFMSLRNLIHALHSMKRATRLAQEWSPDVVLVVRPDLEYHESLGPYVQAAMERADDHIVIPDWQHWRGGLNDRFAICKGSAATDAYAMRGDLITAYCTHFKEPLHPESLVRFVLERANISVDYMPVRATRIRADGRAKNEHFEPSRVDAIKTGLRNIRRRLRGVR